MHYRWPSCLLHSWHANNMKAYTQIWMLKLNYLLCFFFFLVLFSITHFYGNKIFILYTKIVMWSEANCTESKNVWWQHFKNVLSLVQLQQQMRKRQIKKTHTHTIAIARIIAVLIFVKCSWKISLLYMTIFFVHGCVGSHSHCVVPWHPRHVTTWILECFDFQNKLEFVCVTFSLSV